MLTVGSILMVPVIIAIAGGSVVLISKVGGKNGRKENPLSQRCYR